MRWPALIQAGSETNVPVCQTDYLATIAEIIGVKLPDNAGEDSYSLLPILQGKDYDKAVRGPVIHHSVTGHFAIRDGKCKLNMLRGSGGSLEPRFIQPKEGEAVFELYNMDVDPSETTNLYFAQPEVVKRLTKKITKIIKDGRTTPGIPQEYVKENWDLPLWVKS
tara:strand:- start:1217 stop:1711 length:495 start_codon:yes stop_codon:yes gene_type:complete